MIEQQKTAWWVDKVESSTVEKIEANHVPCQGAVEMSVDIIGDPHREDDHGYNWTRLRFARTVREVVPGATVVMGSSIGRYLARVIAWDFEVSADDPIVLLELLPASPEAVERALARTTPSSRDIISLIRFTGGRLALNSSDITAAISTAQQLQRSQRPTPIGSLRLRQVLGFDWSAGPFAIIVPILELTDGGHRTAVALDDMYAVESYVRALILAYPSEFTSPQASVSVDLADAFRGPDPRNILSVCSTKRNAVLTAVLADPGIREWLSCEFIEVRHGNSKEARWSMRFAGSVIHSPSYEQEDAIVHEGRAPSAGPLVDYALLARVTNPWNERAKIVIAAGIRAFGSWGAAEFLLTHADEVHDLSQGNDFAAVLKITHENFSTSGQLTSFSAVRPSSQGTAPKEEDAV